MLRFLIVWCLCSLLIWAPLPAFGNQDSTQNELSLKLSLEKIDLESSEILVKVQVMNTGKQPLIIPGLKKGCLEKYLNWSAWIIIVNKKDPPKNLFLPSFERGPLLTKEDFIRLAPQEHFSVVINLANRRPLFDKRQKFHPLLKDTPGKYEVQIKFYAVEGIDTPSYSLRDKVWRGESESNVLIFGFKKQEQK